MALTPRPYQREAIDSALSYFEHSKKGNELQICPTGSGKSVIIGNIAGALDDETVVLQPSMEILEQNFSKYISYGFRGGIYSASAGIKHKDRVTFATIGSIIKKKHIFEKTKYILIDEAHCVNPEEGMYREFVKYFPKVKVVGFTATPYRLSSGMDGAQLKFLTRQSPRIFNRVQYYIQNALLFDQHYLAPLEYYNFDVVNRRMLDVNSAGSDYTATSLKSYYRRINFPALTIKYANRLLAKRRSLLVFCSLVEEAETVAAGIPGAVVVHGETDKAIRRKHLANFKAGNISCIVNVGVLTTGFDYPELEAVLIARSTMSLAIYYQIIGRVMRPHTYSDGSKKVGWVVDLGGNIPFFGKVETMRIEVNEKGLYYVTNNGRQLTNVPFQK